MITAMFVLAIIVLASFVWAIAFTEKGGKMYEVTGAVFVMCVLARAVLSIVQFGMQ